jgi:hypothetical protein
MPAAESAGAADGAAEAAVAADAEAGGVVDAVVVVVGEALPLELLSHATRPKPVMRTSPESVPHRL